MNRRVLVSAVVVTLSGCLSLGGSETGQRETPATPTAGASTTTRRHDATTTETTTRSEAQIRTTTNPESATSVKETTTRRRGLFLTTRRMSHSRLNSTAREEWTVTHGGGDPIVDDGIDSLSIELWDKRTAYLWAWNQADRTLADFPIEDGDSVTVDVSRGEHIKT